MENSNKSETATTLPIMKSDFSMAAILLESKQKEQLAPQLPCGLQDLKGRSSWLKINNQSPLSATIDDVGCLSSKTSGDPKTMKIAERVKELMDDQGALEENRTRKIKVILDDSDLWKTFHRLTNEMIVTKNGRFVQ